MNSKKILAMVMTTLGCLLLLSSEAWAQQTTINFDDAPDGTVINTRYAGVTFSNAIGGNIFARSWGSDPSNPNAVSVHGLGPPYFPAYFEIYGGAVAATFSTPQSTVSIDARPFVDTDDDLRNINNRPFLEAYAGSTFLGKVRYAGPLPTGGGIGPMETLAFTSSSANITRVRFSSEQNQGSFPIFGLFDNLTFGSGPQCVWGEVPGNGRTVSGPAGTLFGTSRLFVRGSDDRIYQNVFHGLATIDGRPSAGWTGWLEVPDQKTLSGPAATVLGNELRLFVRGTDDRIYQNVFTQGVGRTGWSEVPGYGATSSGPAATVLGNELHLFVRGTNDRIYQNVFTQGVGWTGWWEVPGYGATSSGPAATVLGNELHLFVRGTDDAIYENIFTQGVGWTGWWSQVPGSGRTLSGPAATVLGNELHLFARGDTDRIYENVFTQGFGWTGIWSEVPGSPLTPSEPGATSSGGNIHIFVRDTDDRILMRSCP